MSKATFFCGYPVEFKSICLVYPPKIKDVVSPNFNIYEKVLTLSQEEIEDEYNKEEQEGKRIVDSFPTPMEYLLNNCYHSPDFSKIAKDAFYLFIKEPVTFLYEQKAILIGELTEKINLKKMRLIEEKDFFEFQNLVRESAGLSRIEAPNPNEDPRVRRIKAKARYRDKIKAQKGMGINLHTTLASICCMNIGISPLNIGELSYAAVHLLFSTYQEKEKYESDVSCLLAGADSKKIKPKYWIRNLEE